MLREQVACDGAWRVRTALSLVYLLHWVLPAATSTSNLLSLLPVFITARMVILFPSGFCSASLIPGGFSGIRHFDIFSMIKGLGLVQHFSLLQDEFARDFVLGPVLKLAVPVAVHGYFATGAGDRTELSLS